MTNFIIIFISFFLGLFCRRVRRFPQTTGLSLNLFVVYVSLPALILSRLPNLIKTVDITGHWWIPVGMAWMSFLVSFVVINVIAKRFNWTKAKTGALILTAGLGNTSFVGFPLLEALLGPDSIQIGILADQPGSFLVLSTLGVLVAASYSGSESNIKMMAKRVGLFPPFIAIVMSIVWTLTGLIGWDLVSSPLYKIANTLVPLALFVVGFQTQFNWQVIRRRLFPISIGLTLKLILMPLFFYILIYKFLKITDSFAQVTVLEAAMATQITSAVVANEFNLDSELANLMVGLSIPISLITVPLWHYAIA